MSMQSTMSELVRAINAMGENRWSDAIIDLRIVHERAVDNVEVAGKLAFALSRDGRYRDAINVLQDLCSRQPREPKWPYMIGYQYYQQKAWKEAIDWFQKALILRPDYLKVLYRKGYAHVALEQNNDAINAFTDCIKHWEKMSANSQDLDRAVYAKAQFQLGKLFLKKGLSRKASRHLEIAVQFQGHDPDFRYELGKSHLDNNRVEDALRELRAAERIKPGTDYIVDRLAQAYAKNGDYEAAERAFQRIPKHHRRHFVSQHLGNMYVQSEQYEKAIPHLKAALGKQTTNHNIHYDLGRAQEALGHFRDAYDSYMRAVSYRRKNFNLGFKEAEEGAKRTCQRIEELQISSGQEESKLGINEANVGVVESYNDSRGFGFITTKSHERLFFHVSDVAGNEKPRRGSHVTFSSENSPKGLRAVHINFLSSKNTEDSKAKSEHHVKKGGITTISNDSVQR